MATTQPWGQLVPTAASDDDFYWWRRNHAYDPALELPGGRDGDGQWRFPRRDPDVAKAIEAMLAAPDAMHCPR